MAIREDQSNYYEVLEVDPQAPHHEIVRAYQRAKQAYAPDSPALYTMFSNEEAQELRKLIEEAFLVLGNQAKRREYDELLLNRRNLQNQKELPDFDPIPLDQLDTPKVIPAQSASISVSSQLPEGFARSRLSVYEVKPEIEKEIQERQEFDGAFIRKVRLYKGINIDQLSKELRISRTYLNAVESGDFESLPAPVFVRGFVVQLSRILGLDENKVANSYMELMKKSAK